MKPGYGQPEETLKWTENNTEKWINCYDENGQSKGLRQIATELGYVVPLKMKLEEIREMLSGHPAFNCNSKLEVLAAKYGVKIKFCPKYHCEINPIEGLWCDLKRFIRTHTDQKYDTMKNLLIKSRQEFIEKELYLKLIKRFWYVLYAYKKDVSYCDVLKTYFGGKTKANIVSHRKIQSIPL